MKEEIGRGHFASVYISQTLPTSLYFHTHETVAIKRIKKSPLPKQQEQILSEIRALRVLREESKVIRLLQIFETEKSYHLVQEYCQDGDLFDNLMEIERYTFKTLKKGIRQLLEAISSVHQNGFVHRDIKLKNVLVELGAKDLKLKLADFGLVK